MAWLFHTYMDKAKQWRWQLKAENGRIVADSGEGYATLSNCRDAVDRIKKNAPGADVD